MDEPEADGPSLPERVALSVIVPAHDSSRTLGRCLARLTAQLRAGDELIVVDDGSTDDTARIAADSGARVLARPGRGGAGAARNEGAAEARNDWILYVDSDVYLPERTVDEVRRAIASTPEADAVVGIYAPTPLHTHPAARYLHLAQAYRMHRLPPGLGSVFGTSCAAIRRTALEAQGGFPTAQRFAGCEDRMLGEQLGPERILLAPSVQVEHDHPVDLLGLLRLSARRAFVETRDRVAGGSLRETVGGGRRSYLGRAYALRVLTAPLALATPLVPVAPLPHLLAGTGMWRFFARHAGARSLPTLLVVEWLEATTVVAAAVGGLVRGIMERRVPSAAARAEPGQP
ncbi:MAG: glycosyltransferase family 2 protein [Myxococcota bacterium]